MENECAPIANDRVTWGLGIHCGIGTVWGHFPGINGLTTLKCCLWVVSLDSALYLGASIVNGHQKAAAKTRRLGIDNANAEETG